MNKRILPRILLIEDNPISREFLYEALLPLEILIDAVGSLSAARLLAHENMHLLFLCDVHLPDGGPDKIFETLKNLQNTTTIIAITADTSTDVKKSLLDIGYLEVWAKPITMAALQSNVARLIGISSRTEQNEEEPLLWDETSALRAVGNNEKTLKALKKMFLAELPKNIKTIEQYSLVNNHQKLKAECHKLLAGCGFVGAARLSQAVKRLSENPHNAKHMDAMKEQAKKCIADI
ncbi:MAG: response regulator [Arenimonas sp.]